MWLNKDVSGFRLDKNSTPPPPPPHTKIERAGREPIYNKREHDKTNKSTDIHTYSFIGHIQMLMFIVFLLPLAIGQFDKNEMPG